MSTRTSSKKRNKHPELVSREHELPRDQLVEVYRVNAMRTIRDIRQGIVNEEDIDKLQNFIQTSIALMQKVSVETFRQAQRNAEIIGFLSGKDTSVVLDPKKQAAVVDGEPVYPLGQLVEDVAFVSGVDTLANGLNETQLDEAIQLVEVFASVEQNIISELDKHFTTPHVDPEQP